jgi:hypothetical protein
LLQQGIQVRFGRLGLCRPIQTALNPGAVWLRQGPELAFGYHGYGCEHDASILESFEAQRLARKALPEGYLAAPSYGLHFGMEGIDFAIHAIMLSCLHATCKVPLAKPRLPQSYPPESGTGISSVFDFLTTSHY